MNLDDHTIPGECISNNQAGNSTMLALTCFKQSFESFEHTHFTTLNPVWPSSFPTLSTLNHFFLFSKALLEKQSAPHII